jgi:hypothetical protein
MQILLACSTLLSSDSQKTASLDNAIPRSTPTAAASVDKMRTIQITAHPENLGDGNNELLSADRREVHSLSTALRELAKVIDKQEHPSAI